MNLLNFLFKLKKVEDGIYQCDYKIPLIRQRMHKNDGFKTEDEALKFGNNACGAACIKMALETFDVKDSPSVKELMEFGIESGAYDDKIGWIHKGMADVIKKYGLNATNLRFKHFSDIAEALKEKKLIISSVSLQFSPPKKGGHLVIIRGIKVQDGQLKEVYFNDPSGWGQENNTVAGDRFLGSWSGNTILIWK
jgi:ABC-type bacteriocin/lantibiotic exporter with double-glycine peptidase domain